MEIKKLIGTAPCDNKSQCKTAGYRIKACGGFMTYLVYSAKNTDQTLLDSIKKYNALDKARVTNDGIVSACMFLTAPEVMCTAIEGIKRCIVDTGTPAAVGL